MPRRGNLPPYGDFHCEMHTKTHSDDLSALSRETQAALPSHCNHSIHTTFKWKRFCGWTSQPGGRLDESICGLHIDGVVNFVQVVALPRIKNPMPLQKNCQMTQST
jgi:hypothetical protein